MGERPISGGREYVPCAGDPRSRHLGRHPGGEHTGIRCMGKLRAGTLQTVASDASCAADLLAVPVEGVCTQTASIMLHLAARTRSSYSKFREMRQTSRHCAWSLLLKHYAEDVEASQSTWRACTRLMSWLLEVAGAFPGCIQSMWSPLAVLSVNSRDCAAAEWAAS